MRKNKKKVLIGVILHQLGVRARTEEKLEGRKLSKKKYKKFPVLKAMNLQAERPLGYPAQWVRKPRPRVCLDMNMECLQLGSPVTLSACLPTVSFPWS